MSELTKKDETVYQILNSFGSMKISHAKTFAHLNSRNLRRLEEHKMIIVKNDIIEVANRNIQVKEQSNILKVLEALQKLSQEKAIYPETVTGIDLPFYATAKTVKKGEYAYFTIINEGNEKVSSRLIDMENRGNVVIILEKGSQLKELDLKHKVSNFIILEQ